ncbi:hypothetical protein BKA61DRAFT_735120 [Leptodontidium sp. MPI-SDFR-AT-0119]|nr:hypothetical protein BKA61DRAFT_735120 [Leptodontidium sp. MPI-SDFR-AT-0119]
MPVKESGKRAKWLKNPFRDRSTAASPAPSFTQSIVNVQSPENEDVERTAKASSDTTAGTDAGGKEPHHPAAASTLENTPESPPSDDAQKPVVLSIEPRAEESQPAPDPTQQLSPALSTSQRLCNTAYDRLEEDKDTAELTVASGAGDIFTKLKDLTKRQKYMEDLVKKGQSKFVLLAKGMIDTAIQNVPQAAPPWTGVCIGLQILLNPIEASTSNLAGVAHVVSRMDWYCALTEHPDKSNIEIGDESFESILRQLEEEAIALYKALL